MNEQFSTNMLTWYVILPLLVIAAVTLIWFIVKIKTSPWKRVGLAVVGIFAFVGFSFSLLTVYYHTSKVFAGSFKFYAYSVFAPDYAFSGYAPEDSDPFQLPEDGYGPVLATYEVYKEDGELKFLRSLRPDITSNAYFFTPGKWTIVDINNDVITVQQDANAQPNIAELSLWWALTADLYNLRVEVE